MKNEKEAKSKSGLRTLIGLAAAGAAAFAGYRYFVRPWHLNWGSTEEEVEREMAGDQFIADPDFVSTRAVTIDAGPEDVFPWLVQIGQGRGGAYSYDWIENLMGLDIHSVDEIIPEFQDLKVGDTIPLEPNGTGLEVRILEKDRGMVLAHPEEGWTWEFSLFPLGESVTRLVSRNRFSLKEASFGLRFYLNVIEPGAFIMERKMLLGIKERVEARSTKPRLEKPIDEKAKSAGV